MYLNGVIDEEVYIEQHQKFWGTWEGDSCLQTKESLVRTQAGTSSLVFLDWWIFDEFVMSPTT